MKRVIFWLILLLILAGLVWWGWTGYHEIGLREQGIVLIMGQPLKVEYPGKYWDPPPPIGEIVKIPLYRQEIFFNNFFLLTQDNTPLKCQISLTCEIKDAIGYVKANYLDPEILRGTISSLLTKYFHKERMINILAGQSATLQDIQPLINHELAPDGCKVTIKDFKIILPRKVEKEYTKYVNTLEELKEKTKEAKIKMENHINQANLYAMKMTSAALSKYLTEIQLLEKINGEYTIFEGEYAGKPEIVKRIIRIKTLQDLIKRAGRIYIIPGGKGQVIVR